MYKRKRVYNEKRVYKRVEEKGRREKRDMRVGRERGKAKSMRRKRKERKPTQKPCLEATRRELSLLCWPSRSWLIIVFGVGVIGRSN